MKLLKNRIVIGVICVILGLLLSFVALPALQGSGGVYTNAVRMKETIQGGTQITAEMVETVKIPKNLVQGSISDTSAVVGRYTNARLYAGDYLMAEKLSATPAEQSALPAGTAKGKTVVSVTLPSLASGVSGSLHPGDVVTVIALPKSSANQSMSVEPNTSNEATNGGAVIFPELHYLEVCMISASDGANADVNSNPGKDEKNSLPTTVSFYANEAQALKLAELEHQGIIHLTFVARGDDAENYIPDAQRVLNNTTEVK